MNKHSYAKKQMDALIDKLQEAIKYWNHGVFPDIITAVTSGDICL